MIPKSKVLIEVAGFLLDWTFVASQKCSEPFSGLSTTPKPVRDSIMLFANTLKSNRFVKTSTLPGQ